MMVGLMLLAVVLLPKLVDSIGESLHACTSTLHLLSGRAERELCSSERLLTRSGRDEEGAGGDAKSANSILLKPSTRTDFVIV